ncbi:flagellar biosynthetic protein FliQ [Endobacter medicaginis]|jgi:flagellar biosynthesis protein FliQ|uniref:Flagellar biosynthetic protein FliQ n=1 Tax=Endobacter medicaginis TaxID=1181271 RepID=A0A850NIU3_9PROT|nr:flagellar biosynthesis protein FliQ [Endobacter medicaginis]MBB3172687.1 flagellar biosynthetic protein FliQ [Endobacter medicaginis]MCX5475693.1 flagellar biosynthesis protein FliQ [Endobacter medicaginis]NVN29553.1 flagellar biosynthesis protein FliQ [Endobacter medicaginis]
MQEADVALMMRDLFIVVVKLVGPPLIAALVVGLVVSFIQAVTQINEATLAFVPKVLAVGGVLLLVGPFMFTTLDDYSHRIFEHLVTTGGS